MGQRRECRSEGWGLWLELQCLAGTCPAGIGRRRGTVLRMSVMSLPGERRWRQLLNRNAKSAVLIKSGLSGLGLAEWQPDSRVCLGGPVPIGRAPGVLLC